MFRNSVIFISIVALLASCKPEVKNAFVIDGTVDTTVSGYVLLQKRVEGPMVTIDSVQLTEKGTFRFEGTVGYPEVYYLNIPSTRSSVPFFIEPAPIIVNIITKDIDKTKITGSKTQTEYDAYLDKLDLFSKKIRDNYQLYNMAQEAGETEKVKYFDSLITVLDNERTQFSKDYVLQNKSSFISPYIIYRNSYAYELEELETALGGFDTALSHSVYTGFAEDYLATLKRVAIGKPYVPFSMPDSAGTAVALSDQVGKGYLLVDFWASWCAPCREENPNLVKLYSEYHERGFDIFGVSFDTKRDRWLQAIEDDGLTWGHVSDLKGWENAAGKLYGIRSIPSNVLLDSNGVIIAKNLRGDDLRARLAEIWPEPVKGRK